MEEPGCAAPSLDGQEFSLRAAVDGIPIQRRVVGEIQHGVFHALAQSPVVVSVADDEQHPVVDGCNIRIGGGG